MERPRTTVADAATTMKDGSMDKREALLKLAKRCEAVSRVLGRALHALDAIICNTSIQIESFGWKTLGYSYPDIGGPNAYGKWTSSEAERARFYKFNREQSELAAKIRNRAVWLDSSPLTAACLRAIAQEQG